MGNPQDLLARNLRAIRKKLELTQSEAAERCDLSLRMYQRLESSRGTPSIESLAKIAKGLNVKIHELFANDDQIQNSPSMKFERGQAEDEFGIPIEIATKESIEFRERFIKVFNDAPPAARIFAYAVLTGNVDLSQRVLDDAEFLEAIHQARLKARKVK